MAITTLSVQDLPVTIADEADDGFLPALPISGLAAIALVQISDILHDAVHRPRYTVLLCWDHRIRHKSAVNAVEEAVHESRSGACKVNRGPTRRDSGYI